MLFYKKWKMKIDVSSNLYGLELTRMKICNINWGFWLKNDGLDCFRIYNKLNADKKIVQNF
jgi:hypothetical protein